MQSEFVAAQSLEIPNRSTGLNKFATSTWNISIRKQAILAKRRNPPWAQGVGRSNRPAPDQSTQWDAGGFLAAAKSPVHVFVALQSSDIR